MIKVGTVCYLTGGHARAGQCCVVAGGPQWHDTAYRDNALHHAPGHYYKIELASGEQALTWWGARASELIPIAPPGLTESNNERKRVSA